MEVVSTAECVRGGKLKLRARSSRARTKRARGCELAVGELAVGELACDMVSTRVKLAM